MNDDLYEDIYLAAMQDRARREAEMVRILFPHAPTGQKEVEASVEFRKAALLCRQVFDQRTRDLLLTLDGGRPGNMLQELMPDWDDILFAAKLLRYIALSARYELRTLTVQQRIARTERKKRHREVLNRWPVIGFSSS